ncbi:MAG: deoxyribose-phosphate aldolase [Synechococcales bacterium]|nr:deoxyribose-phosphate aldolase [Synechococcales bacterium]
MKDLNDLLGSDRSPHSTEAADIDLAPLIDHSLLSPIATPAQVEQWCEEADRFCFAAVCVAPSHVQQAVQLLHGKKPAVCTVIGFPTGATTSATKLYEAQEAAEAGATELDVVMNLGWLKAGNMEAVHRELAEIVELTGQRVKVILEMALLTEAEKRLAAEIAMDAGAAFLKTSTGWNPGATVADIRLLKEISRDRVGIKASGGISTAAQAIELVLAGATRIGTSRSLDIIRSQS